MGSLWCALWWFLCVCERLIFDPAEWLVSVRGDWYHDDKGVRSVRHHALFPAESPRLIRAPQWQPDRKASGPTRSGNRRFAMTAMAASPFVDRKPLVLISAQWWGGDASAVGIRDVGKAERGRTEDGGWLAICQRRNPDFEGCYLSGNPSAALVLCRGGRLSD